MQTTEPTETYRELLEVLEERAGDSLRVAFHYRPNDLNVYHLREGLLVDDLLPRLDEIHRGVSECPGVTGENCVECYGELESRITVHEDVLVLEFLESPREGLVVVVDRDDFLSLGII